MPGICIIKLGALGDVLRTTCILPALWRKHDGPEITWLTRSEAVPLLLGNPYISRIFTVDDGGAISEKSAHRHYDLLICLDDEPDACRLSSALDADTRIGSFMDSEGSPSYTVSSAPWFNMGLLGPENRDDLKKANTISYPSLLYTILNLPEPPARPVLRLTRKEIENGKALIRGNSFHTGVNTGAGGRWELKKLNERKTIELILELQREANSQLWLLGGPEEHTRNCRIARATGIDRVPTNLTLREFASVVANLNLLLTSDCLALHMALAFTIPTVVFFGPTSAAEIDLYGLGRKVIPSPLFQCFYTSRCSHLPSCESFQSVPSIAAATLEVMRSITEPRRLTA